VAINTTTIAGRLLFAVTIAIEQMKQDLKALHAEADRHAVDCFDQIEGVQPELLALEQRQQQLSTIVTATTTVATSKEPAHVQFGHADTRHLCSVPTHLIPPLTSIYLLHPFPAPYHHLVVCAVTSRLRFGAAAADTGTTGPHDYGNGHHFLVVFDTSSAHDASHTGDNNNRVNRYRLVSIAPPLVPSQHVESMSNWGDDTSRRSERFQSLYWLPPTSSSSLEVTGTPNQYVGSTPTHLMLMTVTSKQMRLYRIDLTVLIHARWIFRFLPTVPGANSCVFRPFVVLDRR
jgi:hypothetical protein